MASHIRQNYHHLTEAKEHNNRQNFNIWNRNLDTSKEWQKAIEHFWKESV